MSEFLSSITGKAQNALKSAGFNTGQSNDPENGGQGGILKSRTFESIHHQLRTFQQQYSSSVTPVQKIITTQKGIALDFDSLSNDCHGHSKEFYTWGQHQDPDIKDVSDRLAWISYIEGSSAHTLATRIDASRAPFKALRDAENTLVGLHNQIARIEHDMQRGSEQKLAELKQQLHQAEVNDEPLEKEVELLKRKAVRDSEQMKWQATREYAEKLILLSQGASGVLAALSSVPPADKQYHGGQMTATVRATLQQALDNYKPGDINLPLRPAGADISRSDTRSFGETHAQELSRISPVGSSVQPTIPLTPPPTSAGNAPPHAPSHGLNASSGSYRPSSGVPASPSLQPRVSPSQVASSPPPGSQSTPLNPASLNQAPAPIPIPSNSPPPIVAPNPVEPGVKIPSITPTVAETGLPKSGGSDGPGPSSGSILDLKSPSPTTTRGSIAGQDTKGPYGTDALPSYGGAGGSSSTGYPQEKPKYETAEEEKKRLEREERERVLAAGGSVNPGGANQPPQDDSDLPPYQEF